MGWLQIVQLIFAIAQQVAPVVGKIGALHTAVNATPGTPEHTSALATLNEPLIPPIPTKQ